MPGCSGCGSVPVLFNKFINTVGLNYAPSKPGPFDGKIVSNRNLLEKSENIHKSNIEIPKPLLNNNGTHLKFIRKTK